MEPQGGNNWCWAAVSVSIRNSQLPASPPLEQCELAKIQLNHTDCCTSVPPVDGCDQASQLELALANANVDADNQQGVLSFADVQQRLLANKPVCCAIQWQSVNHPTYHFVEIDGFIENGPGGDELVVKDPLYIGGTIAYQALLDNYNAVGGRWVWTYRVL